jgi:nucleotide-binding universal stress UspA family protein
MKRMKILVAMDGTEHSWKTLDKALSFGKSLNAELTVIGVVEFKPPMITTTPTGLMEKLNESLETIAIEALDKARKYSQEKGTDVKTMIKHGSPADVICQAADEGKFDLLIVGNSGRGKISDFFLGNVSSKIVHLAKTDLFIVK